MFVSEYDKAEHMLNAALVQAKRVNSDIQTGTALVNLTSLYLKKDDIKKAFTTCNQS